MRVDVEEAEEDGLAGCIDCVVRRDRLEGEVAVLNVEGADFWRLGRGLEHSSVYHGYGFGVKSERGANSRLRILGRMLKRRYYMSMPNFFSSSA